MKHIKFLVLLITHAATVFAAQPRLLIKIPTRSRPHQFFSTLTEYYSKLSFKNPYHFLITCDTDDATMNNSEVIARLETYPHLSYNFSNNSSKVAAYNADIDAFEFDILIAAHDDMRPMVKGFDQIIVDIMTEQFPDFDGILNCNDGFVGRQCNTIPIMGRKFYNRFGYVYHPDYKALVCNVELTCISKILRKEKVIDQVLIKHCHPAWNAGVMDDLYTKNETYHDQDRALFIERRARLFDLSPAAIAQATPKKWSILICTIEERAEVCKKLCDKLRQQIKELNLTDEIEILCCADKRGEHTVGFKRNQLLAASEGAYVCFLDDDDDIHDEYIKLIYERLCKNPDCVSLIGIITFNGSNPKRFIHSIQYDHYFEDSNSYYRPPNHINPIKRSIAVQFSFPDKYIGEDTDWAMMIARSQLLRIEEIIDVPYYFYLYVDK